MKHLTEDEFDSQFTPIKNHLDNNASFDGCLFETYSPDIDFVLEKSLENRVVTIIECDDEIINKKRHNVMVYASGYHLVNRLGFLILDKPYDEEFEVIIKESYE